MIGFAKKFIASLMRQRTFRISVNELEALNDRTLRDIGIDRSEIRSVVNGLLGGTGNSEARERASVIGRAAAVNRQPQWDSELEYKDAA